MHHSVSPGTTTWVRCPWLSRPSSICAARVFFAPAAWGATLFHVLEGDVPFTPPQLFAHTHQGKDFPRPRYKKLSRSSPPRILQTQCGAPVSARQSYPPAGPAMVRAERSAAATRPTDVAVPNLAVLLSRHGGSTWVLAIVRTRHGHIEERSSRTPPLENGSTGRRERSDCSAPRCG